MSRPLRFALVTLGSWGDLHPYLAIGRALREQGHEVHLLSHAPYEAEALAAGLAFSPIATTAQHLKTLQHPKLWHPIAGFGVLWRHLCVPAIGPTLARLRELAHSHSAEAPLRVLASPLAVGARLARDILPLKLWTAYTAPSALRSIDDPMFVGTWRVPTWWPGPARAAVWWAVDRWKLEPMARSGLTAWQQQLGTAPLRASIFGSWIHSPDGGLVLYDTDTFAPLPKPWDQEQLHACGFTLYEAGETPLPGPLQRFLSCGSPPVVIFPGSAGSTQHLLNHAIEATRQAGLRAIAIHPAGTANSGDAQPSEQLMFTPPISLAQLLPKASVLIHHGGIGTCAQALSAGTPQLILASAFDQQDNAYRIKATGAGAWLPASHAPAAAIAAHLRQLYSPGFKRPAGSLEHSKPGMPNLAVQAAARAMLRP